MPAYQWWEQYGSSSVVPELATFAKFVLSQPTRALVRTLSDVRTWGVPADTSRHQPTPADTGRHRPTPADTGRHRPAAVWRGFLTGFPAQYTVQHFDGRSYRQIEGERVTVNFLIFYELDQQVVKTVLRLAEYGGEEDWAWYLLDEL